MKQINKSNFKINMDINDMYNYQNIIPSEKMEQMLIDGFVYHIRGIFSLRLINPNFEIIVDFYPDCKIGAKCDNFEMKVKVFNHLNQNIEYLEWKIMEHSFDFYYGFLCDIIKKYNKKTENEYR